MHLRRRECGGTSGISKYIYKFVDYCRKNVPDYSASRTMNDLGFVSFDLAAGNFFGFT